MDEINEYVIVTVSFAVAFNEPEYWESSSTENAVNPIVSENGIGSGVETCELPPPPQADNINKIGNRKNFFTKKLYKYKKKRGLKSPL